MSIVGALPFTLTNGTIADATQVMADFNSIKTDVNAGAAAVGANNDITSLSGLTTPLSVPQGGSGSATPGPFVFTGGYRNLIRRNGGMGVWQRGAGGAASFAVAASGGNPYTADGWYFFNGANEASIVSQEAGIANGSQWCLKVIRNNGQTGTAIMGIGFPLDTDELYPALNQFVKLSFVAKCGANFSPATAILTCNVMAGTAAPSKQILGFTGQTVPLAGTDALTTTATRYQHTSSVVIPTTTRQMEVRFTITPVGTAGADDSFYIDDVQLEIVPAASGYVASNFERLIFEEQLLLCQRHFQKTFAYSVAPASNVGTGTPDLEWVAISATQPNFFLWRMPVAVRTTSGTLQSYNPGAANAQIRNVTDAADFSSTAVAFRSESVVFVSGTVNAGMSVSDLLAVHLTVDAGI